MREEVFIIFSTKIDLISASLEFWHGRCGFAAWRTARCIDNALSFICIQIELCGLRTTLKQTINEVPYESSVM